MLKTYNPLTTPMTFLFLQPKNRNLHLPYLALIMASLVPGEQFRVRVPPSETDLNMAERELELYERFDN